MKQWTFSRSRWRNGLVFSLACLRHKGRGFTATIGLGPVSFHAAYRKPKEDKQPDKKLDTADKIQTAFGSLPDFKKWNGNVEKGPVISGGRGHGGEQLSDPQRRGLI